MSRRSIQFLEARIIFQRARESLPEEEIGKTSDSEEIPGNASYKLRRGSPEAYVEVNGANFLAVVGCNISCGEGKTYLNNFGQIILLTISSLASRLYS